MKVQSVVQTVCYKCPNLNVIRPKQNNHGEQGPISLTLAVHFFIVKENDIFRHSKAKNTFTFN